MRVYLLYTGEKKDASRRRRRQIKTTSQKTGCFYLVGGDGFEPSKLKATDLQSAPFGHSGTLPYSYFNGAGGRTRTPDLLITNQLLYQLSYTSLYCLICRTDDIYYIISPSTCQALFILFSFFLIKWSRRQDLNLRHLGPKPSTLPN